MRKAWRKGEVWEIVNRERKKRKRIFIFFFFIPSFDGVGGNEWKEHFIRLLGGVEDMVVKGMMEKKQEDGEEALSREEIKRVLGRLKDGRAAGINGVANKVWKYGGEEIRKWIGQFCYKIWKGEGWPECWKKGVIVPIVIKVEGERVENYKRITLMLKLYKVYTKVLAERLREEVEKKKIISEN